MNHQSATLHNPTEDPISMLVVEDNDLDQMAFRRWIERQQLPYQYTMVSSIAAAHSILSAQHFDIIIADYHLGDGTASDILARKISIPMVIVTGAGNDALAVQVIKAGACDYLTKDSSQLYLKRLPLIIENALIQAQAKLQEQERCHEQFQREIRQQFVVDLNDYLAPSLTVLKKSLRDIDQYAANLLQLLASPNPPLATIRERALKVEADFNFILRHKGRTEQLIDNLIELIDLDEVGDQSTPEICELGAIIRSRLENRKTLALMRVKPLKFQSTDEAHLSKGNPSRLTSLIDNLLMHIVHHSHENETITISLWKDGHNSVLLISNGNTEGGNEALNELTDGSDDPASESSEPFLSSGLGLSVAKRIVELHQGRIELENGNEQSIGFKVSLPEWVE